MTLSTALTGTHQWLSEKKAHWILESRIHAFTRDLGLQGPQLEAALAKAIAIYQQMSEEDLRNTIARFEEHYFDPIEYGIHSSPPTC